MRIVINVEVNYDGATVDDKNVLIRAVERKLEHFVGDGGLSPTGEEIVDDYRISIEKR